ncbi:hypothetical protein FJT64_005743 [Amphibalanus amphitrite]|uniref:Uncharacterized protein n=1 Tax=Amphibalanus amphitrite TaxID=1232801 RepID=A0A6A4VKC7_AMPAM|nr:hypothetical protein FJT64_005743 [Amphibalanus amphitrite]
MQTPIFRTEEPLWFLETAWCSQTQMGFSESTVWDLQSLMGARQVWTLGDAGMGPSEMPNRKFVTDVPFNGQPTRLHGEPGGSPARSPSPGATGRGLLSSCCCAGRPRRTSADNNQSLFRPYTGGGRPAGAGTGHGGPERLQELDTVDLEMAAGRAPRLHLSPPGDSPSPPSPADAPPAESDSVSTICRPRQPSPSRVSPL